MKSSKITLFKIIFIYLLFLCPCAAQDEVEYVINIPKPENHFFEITINIKNPIGEFIDLAIPQFIPGTYSFEAYAGDIQEFCANDSQNNFLKWERRDLYTWRVYSAGRDFIQIKYRVYAAKTSTVDSFLNTQKSLINEAGLLMYIKDKSNMPCRLILNYPASWKIATTLEEIDKNTYTAPDYGTLIDCPIFLGNFKTAEFSIKDTRYILVLDESLKFIDLDKLRETNKKIVEKELEMMGSVPFKKYIFFYIYTPYESDGLEHSNCTIITSPPNGDEIEWITAHEFFHVWNDKLIYAQKIFPFQYDKGELTRLYWFFEGFTMYYGFIISQRCGIYTPEELYAFITDDFIKNIEETNAIKHQSLEDASLSGFFIEPQNYYENFLDFYRKGAIVALFMDLKIRHDTQNKKSLDDVMRYIYKNYGLQNKGLPEEGMEKIFNEAVGVDFKEIFTDYIKDTKGLDYNKYLDYAGLKMELKDDTEQLYLGFKAEYTTDGYIINKIEKNSPAEIAGLSVDDIIIAINDMRLIEGNLIDLFKPGKAAELSIFRNDVLITKTILPENKVKKEYKICEIENPDSLQKSILKSWLEL